MLLPPVVRIVAVLGSILGGIATPAVALAALAVVLMLVLTRHVDLCLRRSSPTVAEAAWIGVAAGLALDRGGARSSW